MAPEGSAAAPPSAAQDDRTGDGASRDERIERHLSWLVQEMRSSNGAIQMVTEQLADLSRRVKALEGVERDGGVAIRDLEDMRRGLAWMAGEIQARTDVLTRAADEVDRMGTELSSVKLHTTDQVAALQTRVRQVEMAQGPVGLRHELDRVAAEVTGVPDFAELGRAALRTIELDSAMAGLRQDVERVSRSLGGVQQAAMTHVAGRTAPLEGAIHEVRQALTTMSEEAALARADSDARTSAVMDHRFQAVEARLTSLDSLSTDVEGLYRELDRVAERSTALADSLAGLVERAAGIEGGLDEVRQGVDQLAVEVIPNQQVSLSDVSQRVQSLGERMDALSRLTGELDELRTAVGGLTDEVAGAQQAALAATTEQLAVGARLRELESVPTDIEGLHRELDRVTGEASTIRESVLGAVVERLMPIEAGLGQLDTKVNAVTESLLGNINELAGRIGALEPMTEDFEGVHRELDRLMAETSTLREAVIADLAERVAPVVEGLSGVRSELGARSETAAAAVADVESRLVAAIAELASRLAAVEPVMGQYEPLAGQIEDLAKQLKPLEPMVGEFDGVHRELDRAMAAVSAEEIRVGNMAERLTGAQQELEALRDDFGNLATEAQTALETMASRLGDVKDGESLAEAVSALRKEVAELESLRSLESVPERMHTVLDDVNSALAAHAGRQQADLAAALAEVQEFESRLGAIESVPADMDGLYAALYGLAASMKALGAEVPDVMPEPPKLVGTRRLPPRKPREKS